MESQWINNENIRQNNEDLTTIQNFYKDSVIFITGCTGFLGQLLMEKLLRSCSQLSTMYILVRNKKGKEIQTRVDEIFDGPVFDRLKKENPKFRHKVFAIAGDCALPKLGISEQDRKLLIDEVRFIQPLD